MGSRQTDTRVELMPKETPKEARVEEIAAQPHPSCDLCGAAGETLYRGLRDRLFGAPGEWTLKRCPNPKCGQLWLDPMPVEQDIPKAYRVYYTHQTESVTNTFARRVIRFVKAGYWAEEYGYRRQTASTFQKWLGILAYLHVPRRALADYQVMYLPACPGGILLDVGCGRGEMLGVFQNLGWLAEGVDIDAVAIGIAQAEGFRVRLGNLEEQRYPDEHFDAITMSHVIEHVHNPERLLRECHRILKRGGRLVVVTPNCESWGHGRFKAHWLHLDPPRHLRLFNTRALREISERSGFRLLGLSTTIRRVDEVFRASRSIQSTGQYVVSVPEPISRRIWAKFMQLAEWGILKVKPDRGEEICLVATK